jgi:hypothetical protein
MKVLAKRVTQAIAKGRLPTSSLTRVAGFTLYSGFVAGLLS